MLAKTATILFFSALSHLEALVLNRYLGTSPDQPSLAISLKTLELLQCIKLCKASFSIEAFTKLLCHYYSIPYRRSYRTALTDTFNIYLMLLRAVDRHVCQALGRDSPNWRACNGCPACGYNLADEPRLEFTHMFCMDGNVSLKRVRKPGGRQAVDTRVFEDNDYFLPISFVNEYAYEVAKHPPSTQESNQNTDTPSATAHSSLDSTTCTKNWKVAAADEKKRTWDIFEEAGIFAAACRHTITLWIVDMVQSGEL
ncbi:hypothetical protein LXA43DRAFT_901762 [Ganoderma leucocontextum]|nr:hypothetical protein LXA43DRAFT_901762 [Ganoderma leucocontextum]